MKLLLKKSVIVEFLAFAATMLLILMPGEKTTQPATALIIGCILIEILYIFQLFRYKRAGKALYIPSVIATAVWAFLFVWELLVTELNCLHPVLYPAPENVFYVFQSQYPKLIQNALASLTLLGISIGIGAVLGVLLGVIAGWVSPVGEILCPIANVLAPIPSIVYAPYIISLMPSFRSASAVVIIIGIFFPMFFNMVSRVRSIDAQIIDSATMMHVNNAKMIRRIILPYIFPGFLSGLKVTLTTSFMLLMFAEMMGATSGLGYYIVNYNTYGNYTNVIACIIVIGIIVTILNIIVEQLKKILIKWE